MSDREEQRRSKALKEAEKEGKLNLSFLQKGGAPGSKKRKRGRKRGS